MKLGSSPWHVGMVPLDPRYATSIRTELGMGVEIRALEKNCSSSWLFLCIDDYNCISNFHFSMIFMYCEDQVWIYRVDFEISESQSWIAFDDLAALAGRRKAKNAVGIGVCKDEVPIMAYSCSSTAVLMDFAFRTILLR